MAKHDSRILLQIQRRYALSLVVRIRKSDPIHAWPRGSMAEIQDLHLRRSCLDFAFCIGVTTLIICLGKIASAGLAVSEAIVLSFLPQLAAEPVEEKPLVTSWELWESGNTY